MKKFWLLIVLCAFAVETKALDTAEYDSCYNKAKDDYEVALCMKAQTIRVNNGIKEIYQNIAKHPDIQKWQKGTALTGNLKEMYNSWLDFRNRYCSLYTHASNNAFGGEEFHRERCLLTLTQDHYDQIHTVIINANSGGEEDDE